MMDFMEIDRVIYQKSEEQHVAKYVCGIQMHGAYALLVDKRGKRVSKEDMFRMFCVGLLIYVVDDDALYEADAYMERNDEWASMVRFYDEEGSAVYALSDGKYMDDVGS